MKSEIFRLPFFLSKCTSETTTVSCLVWFLLFLFSIFANQCSCNIEANEIMLSNLFGILFLFIQHTLEKLFMSVPIGVTFPMIAKYLSFYDHQAFACVDTEYL